MSDCHSCVATADTEANVHENQKPHQLILKSEGFHNSFPSLKVVCLLCTKMYQCRHDGWRCSSLCVSCSCVLSHTEAFFHLTAVTTATWIWIYRFEPCNKRFFKAFIQVSIFDAVLPVLSFDGCHQKQVIINIMKVYWFLSPQPLSLYYISNNYELLLANWRLLVLCYYCKQMCFNIRMFVSLFQGEPNWICSDRSAPEGWKRFTQQSVSSLLVKKICKRMKGHKHSRFSFYTRC